MRTERRAWPGAFPDGEVHYFADDGTQAEWGIGRLTHGIPASISRDTVIGTTQDRAVRFNFYWHHACLFCPTG